MKADAKEISNKLPAKDGNSSRLNHSSKDKELMIKEGHKLRTSRIDQRDSQESEIQCVLRRLRMLTQASNQQTLLEELNQSKLQNSLFSIDKGSQNTASLLEKNRSQHKRLIQLQTSNQQSTQLDSQTSRKHRQQELFKRQNPFAPIIASPALSSSRINYSKLNSDIGNMLLSHQQINRQPFHSHSLAGKLELSKESFEIKKVNSSLDESLMKETARKSKDRSNLRIMTGSYMSIFNIKQMQRTEMMAKPSSKESKNVTSRGSKQMLPNVKEQRKRYKSLIEGVDLSQFKQSENESKILKFEDICRQNNSRHRVQSQTQANSLTHDMYIQVKDRRKRKQLIKLQNLSGFGPQEKMRLDHSVTNQIRQKHKQNLLSFDRVEEEREHSVKQSVVCQPSFKVNKAVIGSVPVEKASQSHICISGLNHLPDKKIRSQLKDHIKQKKTTNYTPLDELSPLPEEKLQKNLQEQTENKQLHSFLQTTYQRNKMGTKQMTETALQSFDAQRNFKVEMFGADQAESNMSLAEHVSVMRKQQNQASASTNSDRRMVTNHSAYSEILTKDNDKIQSFLENQQLNCPMNLLPCYSYFKKTWSRQGLNYTQEEMRERLINMASLPSISELKSDMNFATRKSMSRFDQFKNRLERLESHTILDMQELNEMFNNRDPLRQKLVQRARRKLEQTGPESSSEIVIPSNLDKLRIRQQSSGMSRSPAQQKPQQAKIPIIKLTSIDKRSSVRFLNEFERSSPHSFSSDSYKSEFEDHQSIGKKSQSKIKGANSREVSQRCVQQVLNSSNDMPNSFKTSQSPVPNIKNQHQSFIMPFKPEPPTNNTLSLDNLRVIGKTKETTSHKSFQREQGSTRSIFRMNSLVNIPAQPAKLTKETIKQQLRERRIQELNRQLRKGKQMVGVKNGFDWKPQQVDQKDLDVEFTRQQDRIVYRLLNTSQEAMTKLRQSPSFIKLEEQLLERLGMLELALMRTDTRLVEPDSSKPSISDDTFSDSSSMEPDYKISEQSEQEEKLPFQLLEKRQNTSLIDKATRRLVRQYQERFLHLCMLKNSKLEAREQAEQEKADDKFMAALNHYLDQIRKTIIIRRRTKSKQMKEFRQSLLTKGWMPSKKNLLQIGCVELETLEEESSNQSYDDQDLEEFSFQMQTYKNSSSQLKSIIGGNYEDQSGTISERMARKSPTRKITTFVNPNVFMDQFNSQDVVGSQRSHLMDGSVTDQSPLYGSGLQSEDQNEGYATHRPNIVINESRFIRPQVPNPKQMAELIAQKLIHQIDTLKLKAKMLVQHKLRHKLTLIKPQYAFFDDCVQQHALELPVFRKLNKGIQVKGVKLSQRHCLAILKGCQTKEAVEHLNQVILHETFLTDRQLAIILKGCTMLKNLQRFESIKNNFDQQCLHYLHNIFQRSSMYQLKELVLVDSKMKAVALEALLRIISQKNKLQTFVLRQERFNRECIEQLCQFINLSKSLTTLDLSQNVASTSDWLMVVEALSKHKQIVNLNLSGNLLESKWKQDEEESSPVKKPPVTFPTQTSLMTPTSVDQPLHFQLSTCLQKLIKRNRRLQHLNLENTGLQLETAQEIISSMRKAASLLSIHLSFNPFLFEMTKLKMENLQLDLHAKPIEAVLEDTEILKLERTLNKPVNEFEKQNCIRQKQAFKELSPGHDPQIYLKIPLFKQQLTIHRKLGHKIQIKGEAQWQMEQTATNCWVCDRETYCLIFWSSSIQTQISKKHKDINQHYVEPYRSALLKQVQALTHIEQEVKSEIISALQPQPSNYGNVSPIKTPSPISNSLADLAYLFSGSIKNCNPIKMMKLDDFISSIDRDPVNGEPKFSLPNILQILRHRGQCKYSQKTYEDLDELQKRFYDEEVTNQLHKYRQRWVKIIQEDSKYRETLYINGDIAAPTILNSNETLYVAPVFLKPGKHTFFFALRDLDSIDQDITHTLMTDHVEIRRDPIPAFSKMKKKEKQKRKFDKNTSVFSDFLEDTETVLEKCLNENDFKMWKVTRFIKSPEEFEAVKKCILKHMQAIRNIQLNLQAESQMYPGIAMFDFRNFCQAIGIVEQDVFSLSDADRLYLASLYQGKEDAENESKRTAQVARQGIEGDMLHNNHDLIRFQLIEVLLRVIRAKFIETKVFDSYVPAIDHFFKVYYDGKFKLTMKPVQQFRIDYLWTLEVDDLFQANRDGLTRLYQAIAKPKKIVNYSQAIRFMQGKLKIEDQRKKRQEKLNEELLAASKSNADIQDTVNPKMSRISKAPDRQKKTSEFQLQKVTSNPESLQAANSPQIEAVQESKARKEDGGFSSDSFNLNEKQARFCYALSKQTIIQEAFEFNGTKYDKLTYVEFLEMLGRMASVIYEGQEFKNETFIHKLENVVEQALSQIGCERLEVVVIEEESSIESDQDY